MLASKGAPPRVLDSLNQPENVSRDKEDRIPEHIRKRPWSSYYDQALADRVYAIYEKYFDVLGYKRSSWQ